MSTTIANVPVARASGPTLSAMHGGLVLAGLGTALLGPILPLLAHQWHLLDAQSGLLMAAKFSGAFLGGVTVSRNLRLSLLLGFFAGAAGFAGFALAPGMVTGCLALALGGFGIGRIITATNILAGQRFTARRGSALSLLNFSFSAGAMLSAIGAAWLLPRFPLRAILLGFASAFALVGVWLLVERSGRLSRQPEQDAAGQESPSEIPGSARPLAPALFACFGALLFLYGGLETSLSNWLTTFALRYGNHSFGLSEYTTLVFWMSLTVGRAVFSAVMLRLGERALQRGGLLASALLVGLLGFAHGGIAIAVVAGLLGFSLSPFFPATFALLMAERPPAAQAGLVLAVSGLGAAGLPWLMGVVSTQSGSLQIALVLPLLAALGLLGVSFISPPVQQSRRA